MHCQNFSMSYTLVSYAKGACCRVSVNERQGGAVKRSEILQSSEWQMHRCASAAQFGGTERWGSLGRGVGLGRGVMLIKAAHLQPIKEPLSLINWNLLKHAALENYKTSRLCCMLTHSLFISFPLPVSSDQWIVPGALILSGMLRGVFGCIWLRNRDDSSRWNICAEHSLSSHQFHIRSFFIDLKESHTMVLSNCKALKIYPTKHHSTFHVFWNCVLWRPGVYNVPVSKTLWVNFYCLNLV